jgi:hypothetical protein
MAQLSRPYQVALAAIVLLAAVWLLALRGHSSGGGEPAPAHAPKPSTSTRPGAPYTPYKGSAPGVAGLTRAIQKAHGAVAQSERNAKQLEEKSGQASSSGTGQAKPSGSTSATRRASTPAPASKGVSEKQKATARHVTRHHVRTQVAGTSGLPARQVMVERELKRGFTAAILFWNPAAADDVEVRSALRRLLAAQRHEPSARRAGRELGDGSVVVEPRSGEERIALHESTAGQVAFYGSFTRAVQVYQTPTLLLVNPRGQATVLTGFTDAFSIEQALDEPQA